MFYDISLCITMFYKCFMVFHNVLRCLEIHAPIGIADHLRDHDNAAGIGDNTAGIGDNATGIGNNSAQINDNTTGIVDIAAKVIPF